MTFKITISYNKIIKKVTLKLSGDPRGWCSILWQRRKIECRIAKWFVKILIVRNLF
ncbi:hypothetical protein HpBTM60_28900 [Helicobacter pylori]